MTRAANKDRDTSEDVEVRFAVSYIHGGVVDDPQRPSVVAVLPPLTFNGQVCQGGHHGRGSQTVDASQRHGPRRSAVVARLLWPTRVGKKREF